MKSWTPLLGIVLLCCASPAMPWGSPAEVAALAQDPYWLRLGHYQRRDEPWSAPYRSRIRTQSFFLHPEGATDPALELQATWAALSHPDARFQQQVACRYPARLAWLREQLGADPAAALPTDCPDYEQWRGMIQAHRVSLIFPTYHLNSPSSMFGHTLLRVDPPQREGWSDWLSFAINFGAEVTPGDNSILYAWKGLFGGYPGRFNVEPYYQKIKSYGRIDDRDIWEYQLDLSPAETHRLVQHLWELKEIDFDYYFFDENCSYRVLELLEIARPSLKLTEPFVLTAIPVDTVRAVIEADLVETTTHRPSRSTEVKRMLAALPDELQARVPELRSDPRGSAEQSWYRNLAPDQRALLIETAYRHLRFSQRRRARDARIAANSHALLLLLKDQGAKPELPAAAPPPRPESGHESKRFSLGWQRIEQTDFAHLGFRMSFHNLEERLDGFLPGAQINLGKASVRIGAGSLRLSRFDVVDIVSLTPRDQFFQAISWQVRFGLERQFGPSGERQVVHLNGGGGGAWSPWSGGLSYAMLAARAEINRAFNPDVDLAGGLRLGYLQHWSGQTTHLAAQSLKFSQGLRRDQIRLRHGIALAPQWSVLLEYEQTGFSDDQVRAGRLALRHYFR